MKADIRSFVVTSSGLSLDIRYMKVVFYRPDYKRFLMCRLIKTLGQAFASKNAAEHLKRPAELLKHSARPRVWKARPRVCVITGLWGPNCYITDFIVHVPSYFLQCTLHCSCFNSFPSVRTSLIMFHFYLHSPSHSSVSLFRQSCLWKLTTYECL